MKEKNLIDEFELINEEEPILIAAEQCKHKDTCGLDAGSGCPENDFCILDFTAIPTPPVV